MTTIERSKYNVNWDKYKQNYDQIDWGQGKKKEPVKLSRETAPDYYACEKCAFAEGSHAACGECVSFSRFEKKEIPAI